MTSVIDIAWLAGIIEGEGCICIRPAGRTKHHHSATIGLTITMTDRDVIERVARLLGCMARPARGATERHKMTFRADVWGRKAAAWLMMTYALLGERRRAKAREALAVWKLSPIHNRDKEFCKRGHRLTPDNLLAIRTSARTDRVCKTCARERMREFRKNMTEEQHATLKGNERRWRMKQTPEQRRARNHRRYEKPRKQPPESESLTS
jgi:hypothetical protein